MWISSLFHQYEVLPLLGTEFISESAIISRFPAPDMDYTFNDSKSTRRTAASDNRTSPFVRRFISGFETAQVVADDEDEIPDPVVIAINARDPIPAELELKHYSRDHFVRNFDGKPVISFPVKTFLDGFGLYRNAHRSLMGWYIICAALTFEAQARRANTHILTFGPHGSNFKDVVKVLLPYLIPLEAGKFLDVHGEQILVCAFTLMYIGDMKQQNENAGIKGPTAKLSCRRCYIPSTQRDDMQAAEIPRNFWQDKYLRQDLANMPSGKPKEDRGTELGMLTGEVILALASPALDLIRATPSDPAHSELQGVAQETHQLLLDGILTEAAKSIYLEALQNFKFPPGQPKIRSPVKFLGSYTIAEHARWANIIAVLL